MRAMWGGISDAGMGEVAGYVRGMRRLRERWTGARKMIDEDAARRLVVASKDRAEGAERQAPQTP